MVVIIIAAEFYNNSILFQQVFKLVKKSIAYDVLLAHFEQESHAGVARIRVDAMFRNDLVVCLEQDSEWKAFDLWASFGAGNNLEEKADICMTALLVGALDRDEEKNPSLE